LKASKVNLFVSSVLFVFWYHSPNLVDTPPTTTTFTKRRDKQACLQSGAAVM
jgi:hypothetical protein